MLMITEFELFIVYSKGKFLLFMCLYQFKNEQLKFYITFQIISTRLAHLWEISLYFRNYNKSDWHSHIYFFKCLLISEVNYIIYKVYKNLRKENWNYISRLLYTLYIQYILYIIYIYNHFNLSWEIIFVSKGMANLQIEMLISLIFDIAKVNHYFVMVVSAKQSWTTEKIEM